MCCKMLVTPVDKELAYALLPTGLFVPFSVNEWRRGVPEENAYVRVSIGEDGVHFSILPTITMYAHHHGKRITAGIYFEMAAKYAEKCDGKIIQQSNIAACISDSTAEKLLAVYPNYPLDWNSVCKGFQEEILGLGASGF